MLWLSGVECEGWGLGARAAAADSSRVSAVPAAATPNRPTRSAPEDTARHSTSRHGTAEKGFCYVHSNAANRSTSLNSTSLNSRTKQQHKEHTKAYPLLYPTYPLLQPTAAAHAQLAQLAAAHDAPQRPNTNTPRSSTPLPSHPMQQHREYTETCSHSPLLHPTHPLLQPFTAAHACSSNRCSETSPTLHPTRSYSPLRDLLYGSTAAIGTTQCASTLPPPVHSLHSQQKHRQYCYSPWNATPYCHTAGGVHHWIGCSAAFCYCQPPAHAILLQPTRPAATAHCCRAPPPHLACHAAVQAVLLQPGHKTGPTGQWSMGQWRSQTTPGLCQLYWGLRLTAAAALTAWTQQQGGWTPYPAAVR